MPYVHVIVDGLQEVAVLERALARMPRRPRGRLAAAAAFVAAGLLLFAYLTGVGDERSDAMRAQNRATVAVRVQDGARAGAAVSAQGGAGVTMGGRRGGVAVALPRPDHIVVVVFENRAYGQVVGLLGGPYITSLAKGGADFTRFFAETHPSQPNYFDMFSGTNQGVTDDACPPPGSPYSTANLGQELIAAGRTWGSYNEGLPAAGSTVCTSGRYARKHNPWFSFSNVPASTGHTFAQFPTDFTKLPTVSFVVPNLCNDMHDCRVRTGDNWLKNNLGDYAEWARTHNSLLVVTFDEDNRLAGNRIATIFYGAQVKPGDYGTEYNHYNLLRTIEDMYGMGHAGNAASAAPITEVWQ